MTTPLERYVYNTENPSTNFELARWYHDQSQTAAAITYYLRAADRTDDLILAYECLLHMADCFYKQSNRNYTVSCLYRHAVSILPQRPEAYFLWSRFDEWNKLYAESYTTSTLALNFCDFDLEPLSTDVGYPGKYGLIYEKAVSSYWWGKGMECRKLFRSLAENYWNEMDETHRASVEDNINRLGAGPESQIFTYYFQEDHSKLRFKFEDSEKLDRNCSQVYQDMFILSMLNGKKNGTYLEVGGGHPFVGNNTAILESHYGWKGVSLELKDEFVNEYRNVRKNPVLQENALTINYKQLLTEHFDTKEIDYLQLDVEPARHTFEVLLSIPFEEYKFAVITYEHDYYVDITKSYREKSRKYLSLLGYELIVNDISADGISNFEDWWVHPDLVDPEIVKIMKDTSDQIKKAKTYMLCNE